MTINMTKQPRNCAAITPSDSGTHNYRAVYVGASGDLTVDFKDGGTNITLVGLAAGVWHGMEITRVYSTGTTATNIVGGN
jgi:hypothetical protein